MTEIEYVLAHFEEHFEKYKGKRIILHGSREYAKAIINGFDPLFHFAGIISYDDIRGESFFGLPVYRDEDLLSIKPDLIILTERVKYAEKAYQALRPKCKNCGIELYNMYGLNEKLVHRQAELFSFDGYLDLIARCAEYEIVAFEAMDTLLALSTEARLVPRGEMKKLIDWLHQEGKQVRFSLRKSYPEKEQIDALAAGGVLLDPETELIRREGEDLSFRKLREANPDKKILYFGCGLVNEYILPRCYGIDVYRMNYMSGMFLPLEDDAIIHKDYEPDLRERIESEILKHEIVSFDVFDTLIIRRTLFPRDVFVLVEKRAEQAGIEAEDFATLRAQAEQEIPYANIDQIYDWLADQYDWDEETAAMIESIELNAERDVILPRTEVVELLRFALNAEKRVVLTSDMYLPEEILRRILAENGIIGYEKLFVSCEYRRSKQSGLYEELLKLCDSPEMILHIGDNPMSDGKACAEYGMDTRLLPSPLNLAKANNWGEAICSAHNWQERCLVGLAVAKLFRDPFKNPNLIELSWEERQIRYGISVVGPLTIGFITWVSEMLSRDDYDGVLFLARDGYLPMAIYERIREKYCLPRPIYYLANRRSAFLCCADRESLSSRISDLGLNSGLDARSILLNMYDLPEKELLAMQDDDSAVDYIDRHMKSIHRNAEESREGYLRYSKQCGMRPGGKYAVVDFIASGTIQQYLSEFLPYQLKGFYFGTYSETKCDDIEYYLQGSNMTLLKNFIELEGYFSSPEPSMDRMAEDGTPVLSDEMRSARELKAFQLAHDSAKEFSEAFLQLFYRPGEVISSAVVEEMYAADNQHHVLEAAYDDWKKLTIWSRKEKTDS